jgi:hypothetical protein
MPFSVKNLRKIIPKFCDLDRLEPTLQGERMLQIMDRIEAETNEARFVLWINHSRPDWIRANRYWFAQVYGYDYHDDREGNRLDDRLE